MSIERIVNINGINHWVKMSISHNSKYPIVAVHGGPGGFHYVFERTPGNEIEEYLDIVYYEQRGCGRSDKPLDNYYGIDALVDDLNCLIDKLGFKKIILLGYSFGSELIIEYSIKYPSKVHKLILQAPTDFSSMELMYQIQYDGFKSMNIDFDELKSADVVSNYEYLWNQISSVDVDRFLFHNYSNAIEVRALWNESRLTNTGLMSTQIFNRKREESLLDSSKEIKIPTLILIGKYDKNVGMNLATKFNEHIEHSRLIVFNKSGHFPDYEESAKYTKSIKDFVMP